MKYDMMGSSSLKKSELRNLISEIQEALYREPDGTINPDKEWGSDVMAELGRLMNEYDLSPYEVPERGTATTTKNDAHYGSDLRIQLTVREAVRGENFANGRTVMEETLEPAEALKLVNQLITNEGVKDDDTPQEAADRAVWCIASCGGQDNNHKLLWLRGLVIEFHKVSVPPGSITNKTAE